jgi:NIPSNAP
MKARSWMASGFLAGLLSVALVICTVFAAAVVDGQAKNRVFELRTYTAHPGKFVAMQARFRDHIIPLFKKHNLNVVGFWVYADPPGSENTLVYILAHESREAAKKNWDAFQADPVRLKVWAETEKDGPINLKVDSVYINPIDFSPIK